MVRAPTSTSPTPTCGGVEMSPVLAHGGAAGLLAETLFLVVRVLVFGTLALIARRKRGAESEEEDELDPSSESW